MLDCVRTQKVHAWKGITFYISPSTFVKYIYFSWRLGLGSLTMTSGRNFIFRALLPDGINYEKCCLLYPILELAYNFVSTVLYLVIITLLVVAMWIHRSTDTAHAMRLINLVVIPSCYKWYATLHSEMTCHLIAFSLLLSPSFQLPSFNNAKWTLCTVALALIDIASDVRIQNGLLCKFSHALSLSFPPQSIPLMSLYL